MPSSDFLSIDLLPCPFCGGAAQRVDNGPTKAQLERIVGWDGDCDDGGSFIECTRCHASTRGRQIGEHEDGRIFHRPTEAQAEEVRSVRAIEQRVCDILRNWFAGMGPYEAAARDVIDAVLKEAKP